MIPYQHIRTYGATDRKWLSALSDLSFITIEGKRYLFTVTKQTGGGVTAYKLDELTGFLNRVDTQAFPVGATYRGEPEIAFFDNGIQKYLYLTNLGASEYLAINLSDRGDLNGYQVIASPDQFRHVTALGEFETSKGKFLYSAFQEDLSIHITKIEEDGRLTNLSNVKIPLPFPHEHASIERLFVTHNDEKQYIVAVSGLGDFIAAYEITDDGALITGSLHTGNMGIGYRIPTDAIEVEVAGQSYIIVASPGSATLTVLQLGDDGKLSAVDHILDELTTRFDNITAIDSVAMDGRNFIFVGGVDDGISVFTLQPGGTLLHLTTIEDQDTLTLQDVVDIEAKTRDGEIDVFVSSAKETGISHLRFDPGKIGKTEFSDGGFSRATKHNDLLIANSDALRLFGREGDDILITGTKGILLDGGSGADIFVPTNIDGTITIRNFEPGIDRLDFSQIGTARSTHDLRMNITGSTAVIRRFDLKIVIHTKDDIPFPREELTDKIFSIAHYDTPEQEPVFLPRPTAEELLQPYLLGEFPEEKEIADPLIDPHPLSPNPVINRPPQPQVTPPKVIPPPVLPSNDLGKCYEISELAGEKIQALFKDSQTQASRATRRIVNDDYDNSLIATKVNEDTFIFDTMAPGESNYGEADTLPTPTKTSELYTLDELANENKADQGVTLPDSFTAPDADFLL